MMSAVPSSVPNVSLAGACSRAHDPARPGGATHPDASRGSLRPMPPTTPRSFARGFLGVLVGIAALVLAASGAAPAPDTLVFPAVADVYVDSALPTTNFNLDGHLRADSAPARISYLRFTVAGLAGRPVLQARVRLQVKIGRAHV